MNETNQKKKKKGTETNVLNTQDGEIPHNSFLFQWCVPKTHC